MEPAPYWRDELYADQWLKGAVKLKLQDLKIFKQGADVNEAIHKESDLGSCRLCSFRSTYDSYGGKISLPSIALNSMLGRIRLSMEGVDMVDPDPDEDDGDREAQAGRVWGPDVRTLGLWNHGSSLVQLHEDEGGGEAQAGSAWGAISRFTNQDRKGKSPQLNMPVQHRHNSTEIAPPNYRRGPLPYIAQYYRIDQACGAVCDPQSSRRAHPADDHTVRFDGVEIAHRGNQLAHIIDVDRDSILRSLRDGMRLLGTKEHFIETFSQILQQISAKGENGINLADSDEQGRNLLHWAAMLGNNGALEAMAEVLERRNLIDLLNGQDSAGKTPLILAVQADHSSTVTLLCRTGPSQFAEEIEPNIEDCTGKTALDHAKNEKKGYIVREMLKRADVQYHEAQCRDEMKWIATRLGLVGTADFGLLALMYNQFGSFHAGSSNDQGAVGILPVSVASALSSCVAVLMVVWVPRHEKAGRLYLSHVFAIAFPMCLLSLFSFLFGLLISPNLSLPTTPALPCLAAVVTFFICVCSRAYAIDKYGAQRFFRCKRL